jgi:hypothetical protein
MGHAALDDAPRRRPPCYIFDSGARLRRPLPVARVRSLCRQCSRLRGPISLHHSWARGSPARCLVRSGRFVCRSASATDGAGRTVGGCGCQRECGRHPGARSRSCPVLSRGSHVSAHGCSCDGFGRDEEEGLRRPSCDAPVSTSTQNRPEHALSRPRRTYGKARCSKVTPARRVRPATAAGVPASRRASMAGLPIARCGLNHANRVPRTSPALVALAGGFRSRSFSPSSSGPQIPFRLRTLRALCITVAAPPTQMKVAGTFDGDRGWLAWTSARESNGLGANVFYTARRPALDFRDLEDSLRATSHPSAGRRSSSTRPGRPRATAHPSGLWFSENRVLSFSLLCRKARFRVSSNATLISHTDCVGEPPLTVGNTRARFSVLERGTRDDDTLAYRRQ